MQCGFGLLLALTLPIWSVQGEQAPADDRSDFDVVPENAARAVRHNGPSVGRTVAAAAASAMCGAMVCGLAEFLWNYPRVLGIFWFTFAMAIAGVKVCTEEAK